jgi:hypothetical protein
LHPMDNNLAAAASMASELSDEAWEGASRKGKAYPGLGQV